VAFASPRVPLIIPVLNRLGGVALGLLSKDTGALSYTGEGRGFIGTLSLPEPLLKEIISAGSPPDVTKNHFFLPTLRLKKSSGAHELLSNLVEGFVEATRGASRPSGIDKLRLHWELIILALSQATLRRQWVLVARAPKAYSQDPLLNNSVFTHTYVNRVLNHLESEGLIEVLEGKRYKKQPLRTRVFPAPKLQHLLLAIALEAEEPIEPPYVTINKPEEGYKGVIKSLSGDHPDIAGMTEINEFLKGHQWACKGPVRLIYKHNPFSSGRLITPFQSLPDRRMRVRINTLIDRKSICEVDFNANHLRLNLAVFVGEDAGETPYEDIGELAGIEDREVVKAFITKAMGASNEKEALNSSHREGINRKTFDALTAASLRRYPKVRLFDGFGINA
jgi:hypothetical protein